MQHVYVVVIENDREIFVSRAYPERAGAEEQLRLAREEWTARYGADGFDDTHGDDDEVSVLDGPWARLFKIDVAS